MRSCGLLGCTRLLGPRPGRLLLLPSPHEARHLGHRLPFLFLVLHLRPREVAAARVVALRQPCDEMWTAQVKRPHGLGVATQLLFPRLHPEVQQLIVALAPEHPRLLDLRPGHLLFCFAQRLCTAYARTGANPICHQLNTVCETPRSGPCHQGGPGSSRCRCTHQPATARARCCREPARRSDWTTLQTCRTSRYEPENGTWLRGAVQRVPLGRPACVPENTR